MKNTFIAIYINDSEQPFTDMIFSHWKTEETRNRKTLHKYIGTPIYVIRTGKGKNKLVGVLQLEYSGCYTHEHNFDSGFYKHRVPHGSKYYIKEGGVKHAYGITNAVRINRDIDYEVVKRFGRVACEIKLKGDM